MTKCRDENRKLREQDRQDWEEINRRRAETERRDEQLREAWRRHHPERERDKPKRGKP